MIKATGLIFIVACIIIAFTVSSFSLNFDSMTVYPFSANDINTITVEMDAVPQPETDTIPLS